MRRAGPGDAHAESCRLDGMSRPLPVRLSIPKPHRPPLTGFIGERTNRAVALVTDDFRLYHELAPFFQENGITVLGLAPGEPIPASARAVLGGPPDDPRTVPLHDEPEANWLAVMAALDPRRLGEPYRKVTIGVDPGDTIGLAILADGTVFRVAECREPQDVERQIRTWMPALQAHAWRIHVGDGAPAVGEPLARHLARAFPDVPVATVPEEASTPTAPVTRSRHTDAAIHIAMQEAS